MSKNVEKLDKIILEELGVDIQKYRNEEVVENFVELMVFPQYVITWLIRPIIIAFVLFLVGFFVLKLVHVEFLLYGIIGLILFLVSGIMAGFLFLSWKMKGDMWGVVDYSLEIMRSAVLDINQVNHKMTKETRKNVLGILFSGIIHYVTIPMMSKVVSEKVPFVSGLVNRITKKILTVVADKVKFEEDILQEELDKEETESNALRIYSNSITTVSGGLEKVMNFTFRIAQFPFKIGFITVFLMLLVFVYLIN